MAIKPATKKPTTKLHILAALAVYITMNKVTEYFEKFREASRHLRNVYYAPVESDAWDKLDDFEELNLLLFKHLVCAPLNIKYDEFDWFCVPVSVFKLKAGGTRLPIMINRIPESDHGYWDHAIDMVDPDDLELSFIGYFDWDQEGTIDHRYIMCRISGANQSKSVIGHTALVESHYVDVYYKPTANK